MKDNNDSDVPVTVVFKMCIQVESTLAGSVRVLQVLEQLASGSHSCIGGVGGASGAAASALASP